MAPVVVGRTRHNHRSNGHHGSRNGAQLSSSNRVVETLRNLSTTTGHLKPGDRDSFEQLLLEISRTAMGGQNTSGVALHETDTLASVELVSVVVRAGLEILLQEDPFADKEHLMSVATKSLEAIKIVVTTVPGLLLGNSKATTSPAAVVVHSPLYLWLLPRLMALVARPHMESLQEELIELLQLVLRAVEKSVDSMLHTRNLLWYLQACITGLLLSLERPSREIGSIYKVVVPTDVALQKISSLRLARIEELGPCQMLIKDPAQACMLSIRLLSLVVLPTNQDLWLPPQLRRQARVSWALERLGRLGRVVASVDDRSRIFCRRGAISLHLLRGLADLNQARSNTNADLAIAQKIIVLLARLEALVLGWAPDELDTSLQDQLSVILADTLGGVCASGVDVPEVNNALSAVVYKLIKDESRLASLSGDLQIVLAYGAQLLSSPGKALPAFKDVASAPVGDRGSLTAVSKPLGSLRMLLVDEHGDMEHDPARPHKRQRTTNEDGRSSSASSTKEQLIGSVFSLLGSQSATDLDGLHLIAGKGFVALSHSSQCTALRDLGFIACAAAGTLTVDHGGDGNIKSGTCSVCDFGRISQPAPTSWDDRERRELVETMTVILNLPEFQNTGQPRIWATLSIGRLVRHGTDGACLDLAKSTAGKWCLHAHRSSLRELRIVAGETLPAFMTAVTDSEIARTNRLVTIDFLRKLSDTAETALQETCVRAWAQVARVCSDEELNLVLLRLVEYLGHTNSLVHGAAYVELSRLAEARRVAPMRLLAPFWRSISVVVIKDLHTRPQTVQLLSDLLGITVNDFLTTTQAYTLPYLVLAKKHDIITRIAQARGKDSTVKAMCTDSLNLPSILATLLLQESLDFEAMSAILQQTPDKFGNSSLSELAGMAPILTAFELLKAAGDPENHNTARVPRAITHLAKLAQPATSQSRSTKKKSVVAAFFESLVLGIIAQFSDSINGIHWQPTLEKKRCLIGIKEMVKLGKHHVGNALPQIGACLQSALEVEELRDEAFSAWITMMTTLGEDGVEMLLENTFAIVVQNWNLLQPQTRNDTMDMVDYLLTHHSEILREQINHLPSLAPIPEMAGPTVHLNSLKVDTDVRQRFQSFSVRCQHEHTTVVHQALTEFLPFIRAHQSFLHQSAVSEQPDPIIAEVIRSLLDACVKFAAKRPEIADLCAQCIGLVGCLDPNCVETIRVDQAIVIMNDFDDAEEALDWVMFFLQEILVKAFMSATNSRSQGFLGYAMQEFLKFCGLDSSILVRGDDTRTIVGYRRWVALPEAVRGSLAPFLASRYYVPETQSNVLCNYPIFLFKPGFGVWLRTFVLDLLQKGSGDNARMIFAVCSRVIRYQDISIPYFLLPYVALNVVIGGTDEQAGEIGRELLEVLKHRFDEDTHEERENMRLCSETVFRVLDYLSKWMHEKKKQVAGSRHRGAASNPRAHSQGQESVETFQIKRVEQVLQVVPADIISRRAVECKSFARALFHWERYIRQERDKMKSATNVPSLDALYERLQDIYTQIDEPDGMEGISVHLHVVNNDQQILEHRKAGRWTAVQSWYELQLAEKPDDMEIKTSLLSCLKESGQHDVLLNHVEGMDPSRLGNMKLLPFVAEAAWATGKWGVLERHLGGLMDGSSGDFNVDVGHALVALCRKDLKAFASVVANLRKSIARGLSRVTTTSLQACRQELLKLHALNEIELICGVSVPNVSRETVLETLDHRLPVLGSFLQDKQYLLGLRRAAMQLSSLDFRREDLASAWLTSSRLARKGKVIHQSFIAVMHASQLGADSSKIEHARLLWSEGHHRKAIQSLEGAIAVNAFQSHNQVSVEASAVTHGQEQGQEQRQEPQQNVLMAKAYLLLAKWLDNSGQTQSQSIRSKYQDAAKAYTRWEKGHYYLGRHYNKLYDSEKALPCAKQSRSFLNGGTARLVVQNYIRSINFGSKYVYQTVPRILTLWLDLGTQAVLVSDIGDNSNQATLAKERQDSLEAIHRSIDRFLEKSPAFMFYPAFAQIVARICHPNKNVSNTLQKIIVKLVSRYPQQALWSLFAVAKSSSRDRAQRGISCLNKIKEHTKRTKSSSPVMELKTLIHQGQKLTGSLLQVCEGEIHGKPATVSISRDLGFNHKYAHCLLVVPLEKTLLASLPTCPGTPKSQQPFPRDTITIAAILDDAVVLQSLQRPRKISVRGSDGRVYGLLCKPKDDLRKDQRLMEFNAMINRSLKRDADASKRRLYIKTYAVTPLNEECGLIEWVDNLRPFRDIVLQLYKSKGIAPNYGEIRGLLEEACSSPSKLSIFVDQILPKFPPVFHEWFVEMFPEPGGWFSARLKYTRSCAVMSMVGMVLGLGDRHGENILFEEGNGGTFHVDFNCLFDKGLTFEKPERVPFRLTHNMVDAFGVYGCEGPFRRSCELTLQVLRQNEETLMTILETFVYDPTTDFIGKKVFYPLWFSSQFFKAYKKSQKRTAKNVPETPQDVLDSVRGKVRGLLAGETVSLSVEGHVDELLQQALSPTNLAAMYIGWCAFF